MIRKRSIRIVLGRGWFAAIAFKAISESRAERMPKERFMDALLLVDLLGGFFSDGVVDGDRAAHPKIAESIGHPVRELFYEALRTNSGSIMTADLVGVAGRGAAEVLKR